MVVPGRRPNDTNGALNAGIRLVYSFTNKGSCMQSVLELKPDDLIACQAVMNPSISTFMGIGPYSEPNLPNLNFLPLHLVQKGVKFVWKPEHPKENLLRVRIPFWIKQIVQSVHFSHVHSFSTHQ